MTAAIEEQGVTEKARTNGETKKKAHSVFLGMPSYGQACIGASRAFYNASALNPHKVNGKVNSSSLLAYAFNTLWASALNGFVRGEVSHFAMLHSDIEAESLWLDKLLDEMDKHQCDVLSVVVPIKDIKGLTSTALDRKDRHPWVIEKRISIKELAKLPETFTAADIGHPDQALLINTGCWVAKLGVWSEKICFHIKDAMMRKKDGTFEPVVMSEDWNFARELHRLGLKVMATKKVKVNHVSGSMVFPNWGTAYGTMEHDEVDTFALTAEMVAG